MSPGLEATARQPVPRTLSSHSSVAFRTPNTNVTFYRSRLMAPTRKLCSVVLLLFAFSRHLKGEVFSSTAHLTNVLTVEREIVDLLEQFIEDTEAKTDRLRRYIHDFERVQAPAGLDEVVSNPLHAYQLLKRLTVDWGHVESLLLDNSWQDLLQRVQSRREGLLMPHEEDLQGAALALLRLQETYRLNASDLAKGDLLGIKSSIGLTARDCLYLGKHCQYHGYLDLAIEWYDHAIRVALQENNATARPDEIVPFLEDAVKQHDLALESGRRPPHTFEEPVGGRTPAEIKRIVSQRSNYLLGHGISHRDETKNYHALCRGEKLRSAAEEKGLKCFLSDRGLPYFYLRPIKVEQHNLDPQLFTFHDIIYDSEIEFIKQFSKPLLERSTVLGNDGAAREISNVRTSQNTWLVDSVHDDQSRRVLQKLMTRANLITGLNVEGEFNSEAMQVANYGIGGHYEPHHDYLFKDKTPEQLRNVEPDNLATGDRLATLMFYLSDVTRGGATVFPRIGAAVWPRKGSAVFWYNLRRSGEPDSLTLHGACPVLHGSKWVGNKWIRELNQVFKRPCSVDPVD